MDLFVRDVVHALSQLRLALFIPMPHPVGPQHVVLGLPVLLLAEVAAAHAGGMLPMHPREGGKAGDVVVQVQSFVLRSTLVQCRLHSLTCDGECCCWYCMRLQHLRGVAQCIVAQRGGWFH